MKVADKVVATLMCIFLLFTGYMYLVNYDMYDMVGNYNPVSGYASLADHLQDKTWVANTCEAWEDSTSPVLRGLYTYLTSESDEDPVALIQGYRALHITVMMLSLCVWPLSVITSAIRANPKEAAKYG